MCLASTGGAGGEVWIGIGGANQCSSGTVTFPTAAIQRRRAGGIGGNLDRIDRVHPVPHFIHEVLDPILIKVAYHEYLLRTCRRW